MCTHTHSSADEDDSGDDIGALGHGDIVLIGGSESEEEDESDHYSTEEEMEQPDIDTEMQNDSSLKHDLMSISRPAGGKNVFPKSLIQRELGFKTKPFIASHILPRKREQVAMIRAKVFCGTYDRTGDVFLSASQDCQIRVYDTSSGNFRLSKSVFAQDVGWSILDTAISPSGQQFLYTSWSPAIRLCNIPGPAVQHEILNLDTINRNIGIFSVRFSPNGLEVIAGASDHCVYVYDLTSRRQVLRIRAQENDVNAVAFADASSNIIVSGGDEGILKVWDRRQLVDRRPKPVGVFAGHYDGITFIDPRGDNRHLISNSKDQTIKLWDMRSFSRKGSVEESKALTLAGHWDYRWAPVPRKGQHLFANPFESIVHRSATVILNLSHDESGSNERGYEHHDVSGSHRPPDTDPVSFLTRRIYWTAVHLYRMCLWKCFCKSLALNDD